MRREILNTYASISDPVLVERAPLDHVCFQDIVNFRHELESEGLVERVSKASITSMQKDSNTFRIVVAGIQCVSKSYSFALTCRIRAGERSSIISLAMTSINASQSGGGIGVFSVIWSLRNAWSASSFLTGLLVPGVLTFERAPPRTSTVLVSDSFHTLLLLSARAQRRLSSPLSLQHLSVRSQSLVRSAPQL